MGWLETAKRWRKITQSVMKAIIYLFYMLLLHLHVCIYTHMFVLSLLVSLSISHCPTYPHFGIKEHFGITLWTLCLPALVHWLTQNYHPSILETFGYFFPQDSSLSWLLRHRLYTFMLLTNLSLLWDNYVWQLLRTDINQATNRNKICCNFHATYMYISEAGW